MLRPLLGRADCRRWMARGQGFRNFVIISRKRCPIRREKNLRSIMLSSIIIRIVDFCVQRRWRVVILGILLAVASATYDVRRFSITTDTDSLISQRLPWHQRQAALSQAFPPQGILVVVTAATPENAEQATNALEHELSKHSDLFHSVVQADSGEF